MDNGFRRIIGFFSIIGVIFTILGAIVAIVALFKPTAITVVLQDLFPEATPVVVVAFPSSTSRASSGEPSPILTLTETPSPIPSPTPTETPRPTYTPIPSPTPILNTEPGSILDVSQRWRVDGAELALNRYELVPEFIRPIFTFYNNTTNDLIIRFARDDRSQIVAEDNLGRTYAYDLARWANGDRVMEEVIEGDSRIEFPVTLWPDGQFNLADPQINEIVITISFSKIKEARWRIPVHH